jgi:hypothetical protein
VYDPVITCTVCGTGVGGALVHLGTSPGADVPGAEWLAAIFVVSAVVAVAGFALTTRLGARVAAGLPPAHLDVAAGWVAPAVGHDPAVR